MSVIIKKIIVVLFSTVILAGCGDETGGKKLDPVSVQLKWLHQSQFAGFYAAEQRGFYRAENIDVTFEVGGVGVDEVQSLVSGKSDFSLIPATVLIVQKIQGTPIKGLAVIYRHNPSLYFSLKDSGIVKPTDFVGKKVLTFPNDYALPAVLAKTGIGMDQITAVPPPVDLKSFFNGEIDVWTGYLARVKMEAENRGKALHLIFPADYGVQVYEDTIITTEKMIREQPDLVLRFLRASLKGWRWSIENPKESATVVQKYRPDHSVARNLEEIMADLPLIHTGEDQIGWMKAAVWEEVVGMLYEQGIIADNADINQFYTMEFLNTIYSHERP